MNYQKNLEAFIDLKNQPKPDAIIFDWDNTLVDTWPLIHAAINSTMREFKREEWSFKKVKDEIHKSMRESFPEIFGDKWQEAGEFYVNSYRNINLKKLKFLDNAFDLLKKINQKGILQFVVSNKIGKTLRKEAKSLEVENYFFSLIGAGDADTDKPSTDPVELALSGSGIDLKNNNIWFVGDTIADIDCAYNCGARPIIFGHDKQISKTISSQVYENGKNKEGPIALFLDHIEFINIL